MVRGRQDKNQPRGGATGVNAAELPTHRSAGIGTPHRYRWRWGTRDALPGDRIVEHDYSLPETDPFLCSVKTYAENHGHTLFDVHEALECGFVLQGRVIRYWGSTQQSRVCGPGAVWFCPSYEPNGYRLLETPCTVTVFEIRPESIAGLRLPEAPSADWLGLFMGPLAQRPARVRDPRVLAELAGRIERALRQGGPLRPLRIRLLLMEFLMLFITLPASRVGAPERSSALQERLRPAFDLALRARARVDDRQAAAACQLSVDQFRRGFFKVMGQTFADYALRHRLDNAASDLATSDRPCKVVAADWGFTDTSHLHRLFRRHFGCAPSDYRRDRP